MAALLLPVLHALSDGPSAVPADGLAPIPQETLVQLVPGLLNGTLSVSPLQEGQDRIVSYCCSECGEEYELAVKAIGEVAGSQLAAAMVSAFVCDGCSE